MTTKTFGRVTAGRLRTRDGDVIGPPMLALQVEPHVAIKARRLFPRAQQDRTGTINLADTPEVCRDLEWFLTRYPVEYVATPDVEDVAAHITKRADEHRATEQAVTDILFHDHRITGWQEPARTPRDYQTVAADLAWTVKGMIIGDDVGLGKAQPLDAKVLTPLGFVPMGSLDVGDHVIAAATGLPSRITGIYPQGEVDCYRVTFSDGATTECSADHLWRVRRPAAPTRNRKTGERNPVHWATVTTWDMLERGLADGKGQARFHVPMTVAPDLGGGHRPLSPYLLGVLLGDGGLSDSAVSLTSADPEIVASVQDECPPDVVVKSDGDYRYRLTYTGTTPACSCGAPHVARGLCARCYQYAAAHGTLPPTNQRSRHPVIAALTDLGLWGHTSLTKFIPETYLHAPAADRLALLQGLMDTDGTASPHRSGETATAQFYSSSRVLAEGVRWLAQSLGGTGRLSSKFYAGRDRYTVTVKVPQPLNPFRLSRKAALWGEGHQTLRPTRAIKSIEHVGRKPMQCIAIDQADHLYVTDEFIVTHNTQSGLMVLRDPDAYPAAVVTLTHLPVQWAREIGEIWPMAKVHIAQAGKPPEPRKRKRAGYVEPGEADIVVLSYSKLDGWRDYLAGHVKTVLFDEVQELRHSGTNRYSAAQQIASKAEWKIGLSATPVQNYAGEIHTIYEVLAPGVLGTAHEFSREWGGSAVGIGDQVKIAEASALGTYLRDEGLFLRRTKKQVHREIPEPVKVQQEVPSNPAALADVEGAALALARALLDEDTSGRDRWQMSGEISYLVRQATGVGKAPAVADFVRMLLESEDKVVLYGWHRAVYEIWNEALAEFNPVMFTGSETPAQKAKMLDRFVHGDSRVLLMSLRSGAGLDGLQHVCSTVVFGELDWSPGVHDQAIGRVARDGQTEAVTAFFLVTDAGSDPVIVERLGIKTQQGEAIRDPEADVFDPNIGTADVGRARALAQALIDRHGGR